MGPDRGTHRCLRPVYGLRNGEPVLVALACADAESNFKVDMDVNLGKDPDQVP